jgi:hypothetical protein
MEVAWQTGSLTEPNDILTQMVFPDYLDIKNNYSLRDRTLPLRCKTDDFATIIHLLSFYMLWGKNST